MDMELSEMDLLEYEVQSTKPSTEQSKRQEDINYAVKKVRELMGLVRLSESQDPTRYPLGLAEVLSHYPRPVIDKVCSVSGIPSESEWMPSIKQAKDACEKEYYHYNLLTKPKPEFKRYVPKKLDLSEIPNLFVPTNAPRYEKMLAKHKETKGLHSYTERRACYDGIHRDGVWVPLGWWEDKASGPMKPLQMPVDELKIEEQPPVEGEDDFVF